MVPLPPGRGGYGRAAGPRGRREPGRPGDGTGSLRQGRVCRGPGAILRLHWPMRESREVTIARAGRRGAARGAWVVPQRTRGPRSPAVRLGLQKRFPRRPVLGVGDALVFPKAQAAGSRFPGPRDHSDAFAFRTRKFRFSTGLSTATATQPSR